MAEDLKQPMTATTRYIYLLRHGETDWNRERRAQGQQESRLTEQGRQQAQELGLRMAEQHLDSIYCSSSLRTRETADLAFGARNMAITYCDRLREIRMGTWEGRLYDDIRRDNQAQFDAFWHSPDQFQVDGAETFKELQQRAITRLQEILDDNGHQHIAIVSHGAWIKSVLCAIEQRPLNQLWHPPRMHNCSLSKIRINELGKRTILTYADQPYTHLISQEDNA
ncbi:alpha-ribazole phosphatase [Pseudohongiella nitratireducens]|uniref:Alpha-ribazole phosphatase n=1 Tax=Pseudohongiella nitratireducens TaxID=1768907 RepID=A0A916QLL3_9GAMM|nr:histidine phosphatase family protein [Pseudohongiella nitratireducens]MDF1623304.1 histidine phosphatase family protein [Pseudohongiella nitratireducens]GFZ78024.1 alpha-ribazole phosphatase [Pseudohongiella nitratireducens]|tara:strand:- start:5469 stop:6140 length:672 start_codon:yes stop_codon:yes gene_type:complete